MPWKKGQSGNPDGRPGNPAIKELEDAIKKVQKRHSKTLMEHFVERAYKSDNVLTAITKKRVPDLQATEIDMKDGRIMLLIDRAKKHDK